MAEQIHIGFGIDKNFGRFAGITITSLVHNNIQHDLNIHIVYDQLLPEDMDRLKKTEQLYRNLTLHFYQITSTEGMTFIVPSGHITTLSVKVMFCPCGRLTWRTRCWEPCVTGAKTAAALASG